MSIEETCSLFTLIGICADLPLRPLYHPLYDDFLLQSTFGRPDGLS